LVAGEQQIQDQVRNAAKSAAQARTVGRFLSELFQHAYRAATNIREESEVGLERTSVSSAAISLLKKASIGDPIDSILLVGAGKMSTLAADDLSTFSKTQVWVANRTIERAKQLADRFGGRPLAFDEIPVALQNMHAVLTCTSADGYVLTEEQVKVAMSERAGRQLILIDASVPRNIDLAVARIPGVQLYNIDDLAPFLNKSDLSYRVKVAKAQHLVEVEAKRFYARIRAYDANGTLKDLWRIAEEIREKELAKAVRRLGDVSDRQQEILDILTRRIVNKLLYEPTVRLKEHASTGGGETYEAVIQELFAIDHDSQQ
jgi:glutamyl-tRNA reductase